MASACSDHIDFCGPGAVSLSVLEALLVLACGLDKQQLVSCDAVCVTTPVHLSAEAVRHTPMGLLRHDQGCECARRVECNGWLLWMLIALELPGHVACESV